MTNYDIVKKYYSRESIVKILTSYVLYYQVSLGHNVFESTQDVAETLKKLKELNLTLEPNPIMLIIMEIILQYSSEDNFDNDFDKYLQNRALTQSLKDFVENDKELLNGNIFQEHKLKEISNNTFFNSKLKMQYLTEYPNMYKHYDGIIDDEYALNVQEILLTNL